jgi:hypothetical protein
MNEFHRTPMGRKFYEADLPKLVSVLEKIASQMEESNKLDEKRFMLEEKLMKRQLKELNESSALNPRTGTGAR